MVKQPLAGRVGYGAIVFRSVGPPVKLAFYVRLWLFFVAQLSVFAFLLDQSFWQDPFLLGFVILFPIPFPFAIARMHRGTIELDQEGIAVTGGGSHRRYWWADIERLEIASLADRSPAVVSLYRLFGFDVGRRFLEIKLRKSPRYNPLTESHGTRTWGIPTLFFKSAHLYADDPEALLAAAEVHLQPGVHR